MAEQKSVIVIGAGASGLMAAITAAENGAKVTVLEHMGKIARKIEITGNGKCNFTNENIDISCYNSHDRDKVSDVLKQFSGNDAIKFFERLGIIVKKKNGYCYPLSEQATAVAAVLRMRAEQLKIKIACNINIINITKKNKKFQINTPGFTYESDALIIAAGSKAYASTGSDGSGYDLALRLGHGIIPVYPALVQLRCKDNIILSLAGLRVRCKAILIIDGKIICFESGEVQFIKNGLSGIPIFQLSRHASVILNGENFAKRKVEISIDLMENYSYEQLIEMLLERKEINYYKNLSGFLTGIFNDKIINVLSKKMKLKGDIKMSQLNEKDIETLAKYIKDLRFNICSTGNFEQAQACCGGVDLRQLTDSLESKVVENLYFAGEILDVDGKCGGYNLQWAWSSGYAAGRDAAIWR